MRTLDIMLYQSYVRSSSSSPAHAGQSGPVTIDLFKGDGVAFANHSCKREELPIQARKAAHEFLDCALEETGEVETVQEFHQNGRAKQQRNRLTSRSREVDCVGAKCTIRERDDEEP